MNTETAAATAADLTADHLTRMVFTEAGRMMLTATEVEAYRAELLARRA